MFSVLPVLFVFLVLFVMLLVFFYVIWLGSGALVIGWFWTPARIPLCECRTADRHGEKKKNTG